MTEFIDVSSNNGCDITRWLPSAQGVIVKATEGSSYKNPCYPQQIRQARTAGKIVGHYHFARPSAGPPLPEFTNFRAHSDVRAGEFIVLDWEDDMFHGDGTAWVKAWVRLAQQTYPGLPILIYSYASYLRRTIHEAVAPLWLAAYQANPPQAPAPWTSYVLWQYTSTPVDRSRGEVPSVQPAPQPPAPVPPATPPHSTKGRDMILVADTDNQHFLIGPGFFSPVTAQTYLKLAGNGLPHAEGLQPLEVVQLGIAAGHTF